MRLVKDHPQHSVELVLRVLGIASSTFYGWLQQAKNPSRRRLADEQLLAQIVDIYTSSGGTYGFRGCMRCCAAVVSRGRKRVERLMRQAGCRARSCARSGVSRPRGRTHGRDAGTGSGPPRLHRRDPGPVVGGGCDADPDRRGRVLAGSGPRCVLQPDRGLEVLGSLRHRTGTRCPGIRGVGAGRA